MTAVRGNVIFVTCACVGEERELCSGCDGRDTGLDGKTILELIVKKWGERLRTGFIWLKTANSGGLLCQRE